MQFRFLLRPLPAIYFGIFAALVVAANCSALPDWLKWRELFPHGDKLGHFLLMGGFAFVANRATDSRRVKIAGHPVLMGSLAVCVLAALEESSQLLVPHRTFSIADMAANLAGVVVLGQAALLMQPDADREQYSGTTRDIHRRSDRCSAPIVQPHHSISDRHHSSFPQPLNAVYGSGPPPDRRDRSTA